MIIIGTFTYREYSYIVTSVGQIYRIVLEKKKDNCPGNWVYQLVTEL